MIQRSALALLCFVLLSGRMWAEDKFFDSNGVKIHYVMEGKGEPVLLIHGFGANLNVQWGLPGIIKGLSKDYQVIALDNRGHGQSGKPHDIKQYGMEMVEDQVRLLDHLNIKKAHVVGYSMGAMITAKLVATHPDRLLSATLGGAGGLLEGSDTGFMEVLAKSLDEGQGISPLIVALTPAGQPKPTEERLKAINAMFLLVNDPKVLASVVRSWKEIMIKPDRIKANQVPLQSLIGSLDPLKRGVDQLKEQLPSLEVIVIDKADHMTAFARPEFLKSLQEFLGKHHAN